MTDRIGAAEPVYDRIGRQYSAGRRTDPRWAAAILEQLGPARTVVNVGAGAGSYEPADRRVIAVEPSSVMLGQRPASAAPAVQARAEQLPLGDDTADAALAVLTVHHWTDWRAGIAEMRRVARRRVVLTYDPELHAGFWLVRDYMPSVLDFERRRMPGVDDVATELGASRVVALTVPRDMQDGVLPAFWCRPEAYLDPVVRANNSALAQGDHQAIDEGIRRLAADLESGAWAARHAELDLLDEIDAGFVLVVAGA